MIIKVKVKPNSIEEKVIKQSEVEYNIYVKEPAENNRANNKVIKLLSKEFGVSFKDIRIKNPNSRNKIIEIKL